MEVETVIPIRIIRERTTKSHVSSRRKWHIRSIIGTVTGLNELLFSPTIVITTVITIYDDDNGTLGSRIQNALVLAYDRSIKSDERRTASKRLCFTLSARS